VQSRGPFGDVGGQLNLLPRLARRAVTACQDGVVGQQRTT
jgi:hypothetical protein